MRLVMCRVCSHMGLGTSPETVGTWKYHFSEKQMKLQAVDHSSLGKWRMTGMGQGREPWPAASPPVQVPLGPGGCPALSPPGCGCRAVHWPLLRPLLPSDGSWLLSWCTGDSEAAQYRPRLPARCTTCQVTHRVCGSYSRRMPVSSQN